MKSIDVAIKKAHELCVEQGEKLTPLRQQVLEILLRRKGPVKAYEVLAELQRERESAAPPTAYRALEFLLSVGLIHKIESLNAYVACTHKEIHRTGLFFVCDDCHSITELEDPKIDRLLSKTGESAGFKVGAAEIEIHGKCRNCV
jgi:Fur family transcriptional regulator, zinc uptake regulator